MPARCTNLGGNVNHDVYMSIEFIRNAWYSFRKCTLKLCGVVSASLELKIRTLKAVVVETTLYGCVTWSPHWCHYDSLRRAHHNLLTLRIGWRE